jgi:uncharacterized protein GlcG (DUF336 family)
MSAVIEKILSNITELVPEYLSIPEDKALSNGGSAVCIIEKDGTLHGKMFGSDKTRMRHTFKTAWTKASQVWMTGMKTGEFEKKVYAGELDENKFGIIKPDLIGWEGGQPVTLKDGTVLSVGYSGFRSSSDLEIVLRAIAKAGV